MKRTDNDMSELALRMGWAAAARRSRLEKERNLISEIGQSNTERKMFGLLSAGALVIATGIFPLGIFNKASDPTPSQATKICASFALLYSASMLAGQAISAQVNHRRKNHSLNELRAEAK